MPVRGAGIGGAGLCAARYRQRAGRRRDGRRDRCNCRRWPRRGDRRDRRRHGRRRDRRIPAALRLRLSLPWLCLLSRLPLDSGASRPLGPLARRPLRAVLAGRELALALPTRTLTLPALTGRAPPSPKEERGLPWHAPSPL